MDPGPILTDLQKKLTELDLYRGPLEWKPVHGGSINACWQLKSGNRSFFCKVNSATKFPQLFEKEVSGLKHLSSAGQLATPEVFACFRKDDLQFLLMEWIPEKTSSKQFWTNFGTGLAALHQCTADQFGLDTDNYMGSVVQLNQPHASWPEFFWHCRLRPMAERCAQKHLLTVAHQKKLEQLYGKLDLIFDKEARPSLLHGDLWSGNFICSGTKAYLIDPAVYYGHPAMDLGMTRLFGGFDPAFYEAYNYHSPLPSHHHTQCQVANLYPLLIHLYLFGSSYLSGIESTLQQFA